MKPVKAKTLYKSYEGHDPSDFQYEEATQLHQPNIYDDAADKVIPNTVLSLSTKTNKKDVLPPKKSKKSKIGKPKLSDMTEPTKKTIPSSISTPPPASKRVAKVTVVDHLVDLAYNISTVIGPRYTAENDALLIHSILKREDKV